MFKVRDKRNKKWFIVDNEYLNGYGRTLGPIGIAVYVALCRWANEDQQCWPSRKKIAEEIGISEKTVKKYLRLLKEYNIIAVEQRKDEQNKFKTNVYFLLDKSEWGKPWGTKLPTGAVGKQLPPNNTNITNNLLFNKLNNKSLVTGKASASKQKKTPKPEIDEIINYLKSTLDLKELDGSRKLNRRYANLLLRKFKSVELIKKVVKLAAADRFHRANLTSVKYLYYNFVKIVQSYRAKQQKEKGEDMDYWEKKAQQFKQKYER